MIQSIKPAAVLLLLLSFVLGCKKDINTSVIAVNGNQSKDGIPIPPLDWEGANNDFMPTPPGAAIITSPWGSGASKQYAREMTNDYKSADGWALVYNSFTATTKPERYYFILYNKYRGLLRMYYYISPDANFISSDKITHTLSIEGSYAPSSPMMNFAGQNIIDMNSNAIFASTIEPYSVSGGTWNVFQYEIAYDKNMHSQNYTSFDISWVVRGSQLTNIEINGTAVGSLTGTISLPGTNFTASPSFSIDKSSKTTVTINGTSDADKLAPSLGQTIINNIKSAINGGLQGLVKNVFSGIFKKQNATPDENVSLKLDANIALKGTLSSSFLITSPSFAIPGYDQSLTSGYVPNYNEPLGVFYLSNKPTVKITKTVQSGGSPDNSTTTVSFTLDQNSFGIDINPSVLNVAQITSPTYEVVVIDPPMEPVIPHGEVKEFIGNTPVYTNVYDFTVPYGTIPITGAFLPFKVGLRVSFEVIPNNGADHVKISKTFLANVVKQ